MQCSGWQTGQGISDKVFFCGLGLGGGWSRDKGQGIGDKGLAIRGMATACIEGLHRRNRVKWEQLGYYVRVQSQCILPHC